MQERFLIDTCLLCISQREEINLFSNRLAYVQTESKRIKIFPFTSYSTSLELLRKQERTNCLQSKITKSN